EIVRTTRFDPEQAGTYPPHPPLCHKSFARSSLSVVDVVKSAIHQHPPHPPPLSPSLRRCRVPSARPCWEGFPQACAPGSRKPATGDRWRARLAAAGSHRRDVLRHRECPVGSTTARSTVRLSGARAMAADVRAADGAEGVSDKRQGANSPSHVSVGANRMT